MSSWAWQAHASALKAEDPACAFGQSADTLVAGYLDRWAPPPGAPPRRVPCPAVKARPNGLVGICICDPNNTRIRVDLGHHILFGLGDALVRRIGADRLAVVRVRRSKFANALSYFVESKIPCGNRGMFVLCPLHHGSVLLPDNAAARAKWAQLTDWDRCLWLVDEVEARWSTFRDAHPNLAVLETNWANSTELAAAVASVARFLQQRLRLADAMLQDVEVSTRPWDNRRHHVNRSHLSIEAVVNTLSTDHYDKVMAFSSHQRALIAKQQF